MVVLNQSCLCNYALSNLECDHLIGLNITGSTIGQVRMIILLSTSTNARRPLFYSLMDIEIGDKEIAILADALRVNQSLKTLR